MTGWAKKALILIVTVVFSLSLIPATSQASGGKTCGTFSTSINGVTYAGNKYTVAASQVAGQQLLIKGKYVEFTVDMDTFTMSNYTLTGAPDAGDITGGVRTEIFKKKVPEHGSVLTGDLSLEFGNEQLILQRSGSDIAMKIQAKDCTNGGIFQMEPSRTIPMTHELNNAFHYYVSSTGTVLFTNGVFIGKDSPETATNSQLNDLTATWQVQAGGRMGMVLGEDATK